MAGTVFGVRHFSFYLNNLGGSQNVHFNKVTVLDGYFLAEMEFCVNGSAMFQGGSSWRLFRRRALKRIVCDFVTAINSQDFARSRTFITDNFTVADLTGIEIRGADLYIEAERAYRERAGNPQTVIKSIEFDRDDILVRGVKHSDVEDIAGPVLWRIIFKNRQIRRIEMTRVPGKLTVVDFRPGLNPA